MHYKTTATTKTVIQVRHHWNNTKIKTIFLAVVELESAMGMAEDAFEAKYGLKKPTKTTPIVTHCTKGGRARKAGDLLKSIGYNARWVYLQSLFIHFYLFIFIWFCLNVCVDVIWTRHLLWRYHYYYDNSYDYRHHHHYHLVILLLPNITLVFHYCIITDGMTPCILLQVNGHCSTWWVVRK